jgi:hypothetical protein
MLSRVSRIVKVQRSAVPAMRFYSSRQEAKAEREDKKDVREPNAEKRYTCTELGFVEVETK